MTTGDQWQAPSVYFSPLEWLALIAAIGISIWGMAKPLGGPKYELRNRPTCSARSCPEPIGGWRFSAAYSRPAGGAAAGGGATAKPPGGQPPAGGGRRSG